MIHANSQVDKNAVKKDAWLCKGFCVLVKRNYMRGRFTSNFPKFGELLMTLGGEDEGSAAPIEARWLCIYI